MTADGNTSNAISVFILAPAKARKSKRSSPTISNSFSVTRGQSWTYTQSNGLGTGALMATKPIVVFMRNRVPATPTLLRVVLNTRARNSGPKWPNTFAIYTTHPSVNRVRCSFIKAIWNGCCMTANCPKCGALYALVGRVHHCVEREPIAPVVKIGRPRIEDHNKTLTALKPWAKLGMSERTWYRRQSEKRAKSTA